MLRYSEFRRPVVEAETPIGVEQAQPAGSRVERVG
jgi:hypothetical protein